MFSFINRTVFDIPINWDRTRFEATRSKYRQARKLIEISINVQFEKQLKILHSKNLEIENKLIETNEYLSKHEKKVNIFDNLTEIASESLTTHFNKRMENLHTIIEKHFNTIQNIFKDENQYWKNIHSAIDQKLITSNDIHRCVQNTSQSFNDNSAISVEMNSSPSLDEHLLITKPERVSIVLPSINKTYLIKLDETKNRLSSIETYSQPNPPAQLYFSPTILQSEQSENIRNVLSPVDQNQTNLMKPRVILERIAQTFLIDYFKTEENNQKNSFTLPEPIVNVRSRSRIKTESKSIKSTSIALRKRKSVSIIEIDEEKPRKRYNKKSNKKQIPIREPSPLPIIDRSKHYHTRFSSRSDRLNNLTISIMNTENENDDDIIQTKSHSRHRKKRSKKR